ncbi:uncharacterized protein LOC135469747 [Liolophura sinensis]|uniref:uncharacterized protein LOC135469747 n=1 Tax=Liolophura sinensis TaxID=3198878 RepID=UPI003158C0D2
MLFSTSVMPVSFHHNRHIPLHVTYQPRGRCRRGLSHGPQGPAQHGPPAWFIAPAGGPHRHRDALCLPPFLEDVFGVWKEVAGIPSNKEGKTKPKPVWKDSVDCDGFFPEEISINVSDGKVIVNCRHETNDGAGNVDVRQLKRTINVPEDVDSDKMTVTLSTKGLVVIKAPTKTGDKETRKETPVKAEESVVQNGQSDDECSCKDCQEIDPGETTDSSVDGMDIQAETPADLTKEKIMEENPKPEAPVQPGKKALEKEVKKTEEIPDPEPFEQVDSEHDDMNTTRVESKKSEVEASVGQQLESEPQHTDIPKKDSTHETENLKQPEKITAETLMEEKTETSEEPGNRLFEIHVDMKKFNPDSIEVKLNGNALTISGKQEDKDEATGKVVSSRAVYRRFYIPDHVNCDLLTSSLDSHGQMTISAPYKTEEDLAEKVIPISVN